MKKQEKRLKITIYDIALTGIMTAIIVVCKEALSFLPNIEPVSFWIIMFTLLFRWRILFVIPVFILIVGSRLVLQVELTVGMLSYILLSSGALETVFGLSWQVRNIYETVGISKRIFEIWDIEEEGNTGTICEKKTEIPVEFEKVCFGYYEKQQVLQEVSFTVSEGEKIAIVGASGSGKSMVMKLLSGFYEKNDGSIKIFGSELEDWIRVSCGSI